MGAYFTELTVGSGAGVATFDLIVDTGSSNTGVPSVGCTTCGANPTLYNASLSSTAKPLSCTHPWCVNCVPPAVGSTSLPFGWDDKSRCTYGPSLCTTQGNDASEQSCGFGITYGGGGGGATMGTVVEEKACFGGTDLCAHIFLDQQLQQFPAGTQSAGILGLAFPPNACNPTCQPTFIDSFVGQGVLREDQNLFGMCLTPSNGGVIDFGYVNSSRFEGPLLYTPVVLQRWYNIAIDDILIGGQSIGVPPLYYQVTNDIIGSFVDSGTSILLVGPYTFSVISTIMQSQYSYLPHVSELFVAKCARFDNISVIQDYPTFEFHIAGLDKVNGDFTLAINGYDYLIPVSDNIYCLGIAGVASVGIILGDVVMQNYYIVFDRVNSRLGFAPSLNNCNR